jgi:hypothetical protein
MLTCFSSTRYDAILHVLECVKKKNIKACVHSHIVLVRASISCMTHTYIHTHKKTHHTEAIKPAMLIYTHITYIHHRERQKHPV